MELFDGPGNLIRPAPGGEFHRAVWPARIDAVAAHEPGQVVRDVGLQQRDGVAELAQRVEEVQVRPVPVAVRFGYPGRRLQSRGGYTGLDGLHRAKRGAHDTDVAAAGLE
ncbi:hypothetical protein SDC9_177704 [bioreactor metagenome]|uniref:Uncharacterized protein n=1 Tax=bioreactor metagenome TaxID=1076179 RepID=A0A645GTR3_9ZZZZ